ncbi:hypothetical protein BDF21DRAFT_495014 [Thamnidium elegans]|nr:hypothetical protein BDF21DRAFT_495014 [Thamnidium elegans]
MEGVPALRSILEQYDYICKIDLKDAYVVVPLHPLSKQYLTFLHQDTLYQAIEKTGNSIGLLPRRYLLSHKIEERNEEGSRDNYHSPEESRLYNQLQEKQFFSSEDTRISGLPVQYSNNEDRITITKIEENREPNKTSQEVSNKFIMPVDCKYLQRDLARSLNRHKQNWESPCQLSPLSHEDLTWWENFAGSRNGLPVHQEVLQRQPDLDIYVDASDSGYGISSTAVKTYGFWTEEEKSTSINDFLRQQDSYKICNEGRRNSITDTTGFSIEDSVCTEQTQNTIELRTYPWSSEYRRGSTQQTAETIVRVDHSSSNLSTNSRSMGTNDTGCFRSTPKQATTKILEFETRSGSNRNRRIQTRLASKGSIPPSPLEIDPTGSEGTTSSVNNAILDNTILVPDDPKDDQEETDDLSSVKKLDISRMAIIQQSMQEQGIDERTIHQLKSKHWQIATEHYDRIWEKWTDWCKAPSSFISSSLQIDKNTVSRYSKLFRKYIKDKQLIKPRNKIGGRNEIVEIDETKIAKRKYNKGHSVEGAWVIGEPIEERNIENINEIIEKYIKKDEEYNHISKNTNIENTLDFNIDDNNNNNICEDCGFEINENGCICPDIYNSNTLDDELDELYEESNTLSDVEMGEELCNENYPKTYTNKKRKKYNKLNEDDENLKVINKLKIH